MSTFLEENKAALVGHKMMYEASSERVTLDAPDPMAVLSDDELEDLKERLDDCMPLDGKIADLLDWDIQFAESLGDDWYFAAVFGDPSGLDDCGEQLAEFFLEACNEYNLDYDQHSDKEWFATHVQEEAIVFLLRWRSNVVASYGFDQVINLNIHMQA